MKSEKLLTKDWMSSKLGLTCSTRPKVRETVECKCNNCSVVMKLVFRDLIKSTNKHISIGLAGYHCRDCLHRSEEYKRASTSDVIVDKTEASERSKELWQNEEYRQKMRANSNRLASDDSFSAKVSDSIIKKFKDDPAYAYKTREARKRYWENRKYREERTWGINEFIDEAKSIYGDRYSYENVTYVNTREKVSIICKNHGGFLQRPSHHIFLENGCPKCAKELRESKPQLEIAEWLKEFGFNVEIGNTDLLNGLEIDILVDGKLGIEYNGCFWHSYNTTETPYQRTRHARKADIALSNGVKLFQMTDIEWFTKNEIVKSMILQRLGRSTQMHARKCEFRNLDHVEARDFFDNNHISGNRTAHHYFGLVNNGRLVSAISFSPMSNGYHEIIRFSSICGVTVVGGLSKMLANIPFKSLFTYADRRYSTAIGYIKCGFSLLGVTKPGYEYWKKNKLYSRMKFQKYKLAKILESFDPCKTEAENMFANGYRRLWDSGHYRLKRDR